MFFIFHNQTSSPPLCKSPIYADDETLSKATDEQKQRYAKKMYEILDNWYDTNILWRMRILTFTLQQLVKCQSKSETTKN